MLALMKNTMDISAMIGLAIMFKSQVTIFAIHSNISIAFAMEKG
jgi:hypothetical protein